MFARQFLHLFLNFILLKKNVYTSDLLERFHLILNASLNLNLYCHMDLDWFPIIFLHPLTFSSIKEFHINFNIFQAAFGSSNLLGEAKCPHLLRSSLSN